MISNKQDLFVCEAKKKLASSLVFWYFYCYCMLSSFFFRLLTFIYFVVFWYVVNFFPSHFDCSTLFEYSLFIFGLPAIHMWYMPNDFTQRDCVTLTTCGTFGIYGCRFVVCLMLVIKNGCFIAQQPFASTKIGWHKEPQTALCYWLDLSMREMRYHKILAAVWMTQKHKNIEMLTELCQHLNYLKQLSNL